MLFKHILATAVVTLALPLSAHAEEIPASQSAPLPPGYKETTILKGYKVKTSYIKPSAPGDVDPRSQKEVYVPVEEMGEVPPAAGIVSVPQKTEPSAVKPAQRKWSGND